MKNNEIFFLKKGRDLIQHYVTRNLEFIFFIGYPLLGMQRTLRTTEIPLEKTKFSFVSRYQLELASGSGWRRVHFSFQL